MTLAETIGNFLFTFTEIGLNMLQFIIFILVILSWFRPRDNDFIIWLKKIARPVLQLARKITPKTGMIDLSPIIAFLGIDLVRAGLRLLYLKIF